ncbi:hypothetical protein J8F10_12155 [Gemmata sp. G18]|uniref:Uncharacterized protein n=1 Tax=Gemmata palustris TaxID=2822762 RepID=A0ABS5BQV4_9BACT|nr:hypothetical protein [Gemmata palustris]MBP3956036.1 hypothetical protein [Gemmata palustris]
MAKAKSKKPIIEEEDNEIIETPELIPAAPAEPIRRIDTGMVLDMEGYGAEVASALIVNGLRAYLSVVNKGVNLVASNRAHTAFVPVKIEASSAGLDVRRDDAKPLVEAQGVLAFLYDDGEERTNFYLPVSEYLEMAEDRGESGLRLDIEEHSKWLEKYEGHAGVKRVFARLLG